MCIRDRDNTGAVSGIDVKKKSCRAFVAVVVIEIILAAFRAIPDVGMAQLRASIVRDPFGPISRIARKRSERMRRLEAGDVGKPAPDFVTDRRIILGHVRHFMDQNIIENFRVLAQESGID